MSAQQGAGVDRVGASSSGLGLTNQSGRDAWFGAATQLIVSLHLVVDN